MATYRQLINRVLVAIGQGDDLVDTTATSITDKYHLKVAEWVNDVLEEIEDAAQWRVLRQRLTASITAGALSGTVTSSTFRSRVFRVQNEHTGELIPLVFDVTDTGKYQRLKEMDLAELLFLDQLNSETSTGDKPSYFAVEQTTSGVTVYVWPRPPGARSIELDMIVPQSRLDYTNNTDLETSIKVPNMPVVYGAVWWAMSDRGEEFGTNVDKAEQRYKNMVSDAVSIENAAQGFDELVPT